MNDKKMFFHDTGQPTRQKKSAQTEPEWNHTEQLPVRGVLRSIELVASKAWMIDKAESALTSSIA